MVPAFEPEAALTSDSSSIHPTSEVPCELPLTLIRSPFSMCCSFYSAFLKHQLPK